MPEANIFLTDAACGRFRKRLLRWFDREQRRLPWRGERDPYRILVSEIMLQQTRVAVVQERYKTFLRQFPTLRRLAEAGEQSVLAAWSGLGYYRRARALHAAARDITQSGVFPRSPEELMRLPGIGRYTAAAVASIAFDEPVAVVDGNVQRVLRRLAGQELPDKDCWNTAAYLLEKRRPGDFNQALMELGAVVCVPGQPLCKTCPVAAFCVSRGAGAPRERRPRNKATLAYVLAQKKGHVFLQERSRRGTLMPGMWELPVHKLAAGNGATPILQLRHSITTTDYTIFVFSSRLEKRTRGSWVSLPSAHRLPLTGLTRKILHKLDLLSLTPTL